MAFEDLNRTGTPNDGSEDDDEVNGGAQGSTNPDDGEGGDGNEDQYFLEVNDRTKYRTADDAKKAFDEAGKRIATLSPWEKEVSQKFGGLTPQQTASIVSEWIASKQAARNQPHVAKENGQSPTTSDAQLTAEQKEVVEFLKKNGFITKQEASELRKEIDDLKSGTKTLQEQTDSAQLNSLVDIGRTTLQAELTAAKLPLERAKRFETSIKAWIEEDESRIQRFWAGGDETKALVKEGFKALCEELGIQPPPPTNKTTLQNAQNKNKVLNRNPRTLPQSGSGPAPRTNKPQNEGLTGDVHKRAADLFESIRDGGE